MDEDLIAALLESSDEEDVRAMIARYDLDGRAVEKLKEYSARLYFSQPMEAVRVSQVARRLGDLLSGPAAALGRWALANAFLFVDRYREAIALFEEATAFYQASGRELEAARMGVGHVWALAYTGQFDQALDLAEAIRPVLTLAAEEDPTDLRRLGGLFNNLGITYELMGHYEEALDAYDEQVVIAQTMGNDLDLAHVEHNRACALTYLNAFDEAVDAFEHAEAGFASMGAGADLARLAINRGILHARWERYADAEAMLEQADDHLKKLEGAEQQRHILAVYRGLAHLKAGAAVTPDLRTAFEDAQAALASRGPIFEEGLAWLGLGRCHLALGTRGAAQDAFEQAREAAERGGGRPLIYLALHGLANLAEAEERTAEAIEFYEAAIRCVESIRRDLQVETFREGFLTDKLAIYQDLLLLLLRQNRFDEAFVVLEQAKSRALVEQLTQRVIDIAASSEDAADQELVDRLEKVLSELDPLYVSAQIGNREAEERGGWPASYPSQVMTEIAQLETEASTIVREIERRHSRFPGSVVGPSISIQELACHLGAAVALQYYVAQGQVGVFVVNSAGLCGHHVLADVVAIGAAQRRLWAATERLLGLMTRYGLKASARYLPALQADAERHLRTLYDLLWRPLLPEVPPGAPVVIIPDGFLHHLPFQALFDGTAYLVEQHPISFSPSATVLTLCLEHAPEGDGALLVGWGGDRLAHAATEVERLTQAFSKVRCLVAGEATAENVIRLIPECRLFHLAAHARFRSDKTMLSSFSLVDRRLTLAEIVRLPLQAELVVLSGCETGRGRIRGTEMISLARGFMGAGAASLLVSLWRVEDRATALLMESFYRHLVGGATRGRALQAAQRHMLSLGRSSEDERSIYRHPACWAPFVLMGDWREMTEGL